MSTEPHKQGEAQAGPTVQFRGVSPALEFICWTALALAPILRWVNGPAVTDDQFVMQVGLLGLAAAGGLGLRIYNWRRPKM